MKRYSSFGHLRGNKLKITERNYKEIKTFDISMISLQII